MKKLKSHLKAESMNIKEIFRFELQYRSRRPVTYAYFLILLSIATLMSMLGSKGMGDSSAQVMNNAPMMIDRLMGILNLPLILIVSAVMGVPVLRDFEHRVHQLIFSMPIKKSDYLLGKFFGSLMTMLLVSTAIPIGTILGEMISVHPASEMLPFNIWNHIRAFSYIIIPNVIFLSGLFFAGGALTKKMIAIYTQGIVLLIVFSIIDEGVIEMSNNLQVATLFDFFTIQLINLKTQFWSAAEINQQRVPIDASVLFNRILYISLGIAMTLYTFLRFNFTAIGTTKKVKSNA